MATKRSASLVEDEWQTVQPSKKQRKNEARKAASSAIAFSSNRRLQDFVTLRNIQSLSLYILADGPAPHWLAVNRTKIERVVVLMVPGLDIDIFNHFISDGDRQDIGSKGRSNGKLSPDDYYPTALNRDKDLPEHLKPLADIFTYKWPIRSPGDDKGLRLWSSSRAMLSCPLQKTKEEKKNRDSSKADGLPDEPTVITKFLAAREELEDNEYVVHPSVYTSHTDRQAVFEKRKESKCHPDDGWVDTTLPSLQTSTDKTADALLDGKHVISIDCEMCLTHESKFVLTRISVVNWDGSVVFDELVKPSDPIKDYLTPYSGITKEMLEPVTTSLVDVQEKLQGIISNKTILMGHSLNSDLNALKMTHPHIVDTAVLYPHPRGPPLKSSLKWLTQQYLNRSIQEGDGVLGHDSIEDARAVVDLVKLKCQKGPTLGQSSMSEEPIYKRIGRVRRRRSHKDSSDPASTPTKPTTKEQGMQPSAPEFMNSAHIDRECSDDGYAIYADINLRCSSDSEVVENIASLVSDDGPIVGGADFVWARLRDLETSRGWRRASGTQMAGQGYKGEDSQAATDGSLQASSLKEAVKGTIENISNVFDSLPAQTAFIVYSGAADEREFRRLQKQQHQFKREYQVKKWDELSVRWTDIEEQALRAACKRARTGGLGFITAKPS